MVLYGLREVSKIIFFVELRSRCVRFFFKRSAKPKKKVFQEPVQPAGPDISTASWIQKKFVSYLVICVCLKKKSERGQI